MDVSVDTDLYGLIGVEEAASTQEIKKAYRKKALSCHPDKNPDNPRAAELFHELSRALEILTDTSARAAYDKVIVARRQAKERVREFDAKRKKLKEDLEAREQAYASSLNSRAGCAAKTDEERLRAEVERLRKEGSKQVEEEVARVKRLIREEQLRGSRKESEGVSASASYRIKIKWRVNDAGNGGYNYDTLHRILSKYGDLAALVVSGTKRGRALVEFQNKSDAEMALNTEVGFAENPLTLRSMWSTEKPVGSTMQPDPSKNRSPFRRTKSGWSDTASDFEPSPRGSYVDPTEMSDAEFEHSVLRNLRMAEERKRTLEKTDGDEKS